MTKHQTCILYTENHVGLEILTDTEPVIRVECVNVGTNQNGFYKQGSGLGFLVPCKSVGGGAIAQQSARGIARWEGNRCYGK